jgi:hypothetical protein
VTLCPAASRQTVIPCECPEVSARNDQLCGDVYTLKGRFCNSSFPVASCHLLICSSQNFKRDICCENVNMHVYGKHTCISVVHKITADLLKAFFTFSTSRVAFHGTCVNAVSSKPIGLAAPSLRVFLRNFPDTSRHYLQTSCTDVHPNGCLRKHGLKYLSRSHLSLCRFSRNSQRLSAHLWPYPVSNFTKLAGWCRK